MPDHTIIVGGGLAGLAAAAALAARNVRVTLLESRPRLGGRAGSFVDAQTGSVIDNCQHVSMGCCTNFDHFCRTAGLGDFFREERALHFVGPDGRINRFAAGLLPAPLHLWPALRRLRYLAARDRRSIAKGLRALAKLNDAALHEETFDRWLRKQEQTPAAIERFWHVVLVSALSESLDRISVGPARKVFVDAFLANRKGWRVRIPTVPLDELYGGRLTDWLTRRGVTIRLQAAVQHVVADGQRVTHVELRDGQQIAGEHFVVAVPHHRVLALLPDFLAQDPRWARIAAIESAPISSVHLWFDRPITTLPHAVFVGRLSQWMFNRTLLKSSFAQPYGIPLPPRGPAASSAERGGPGWGSESTSAFSMSSESNNNTAESNNNTARCDEAFYYQIVISDSRNLAGQPNADTIAKVVSELADVWPATSSARLIHSRVVTEHKAVFSVLPGVESLRPEQQTPIENLQLAGDWTNTGWPATMESAVRSGYLAAENVLAQLGRPETLVRPNLPTAVLSKHLLRL